MNFSKRIKKLSLIVFLVFFFCLLAGISPKSSQAMLLREKSLRESFFTQLIDEISLKPGQTVSQSIRLNYENSLGIEILFRNPSEKKTEGFLQLKDSDKKVLKEVNFFIDSQSPAAFYFFAFPELKNIKGGEFWVEITNKGDLPLILGYYNQNVYHYGDLLLEKDLQPGVLQFQIHYQINPFKEILSRKISFLKNEWLFFSIWALIIIGMTITVFILAKNYRELKKKS